MYTVWIKIDKTLPWVELEGEYQTRKEAKRAADGQLRNMKVKIVRGKESVENLKALATAKTMR